MQLGSLLCYINVKKTFSLKQSVRAVRSYIQNSKYHFVKIRGKEDQLLLQINVAPKIGLILDLLQATYTKLPMCTHLNHL